MTVLIAGIRNEGRILAKRIETVLKSGIVEVWKLQGGETMQKKVLDYIKNIRCCCQVTVWWQEYPEVQIRCVCCIFWQV